MKKKMIIFIFTTALLFVGCNSPLTTITPSMGINDFAFVINGADIADILNTSFDLVIIDYSRDGSEAKKYTPAQIQSLKDNNTIPIAYLSIGEAEDYRYYWNDDWYTSPPSWLGEENPNWEGNYKVRYWQQEWKNIVFEYLEQIIALGFNGVMLDIIDGYYYWSDEMGEVSETFAANEMINFVNEINTFAASEKRTQDFMIIPQNAVEIIDYDSQGKFVNSISGLSIEGLYYNSDGSQTNKRKRARRIEYIERYQDLGKIIMVTDYVYPNMNKIIDFYSKTKAQGFIPYAADRNTLLDSLVRIDDLQPTD